MMSAWRTTPTSCPAVVDDRDVAVAAGLHQDDRVADGLVEVERLRLSGHERLDGLAQVDIAGHDAAEDVALREHPDERPVGGADEDRIAGPGPLDRPQAVRERGPGRDRDGLPAAEDPQPLLGERRHARTTAVSVISVT